MSGRHTTKQHRDNNSKGAHTLRGLVRKVTVGVAKAAGLWQLLGYEDDEGNRETDDQVEAMPWVGFYARPKAGNDVEAILVNVGSAAGHPVIIATRDRATQVELEPDETVIFTSNARIHINKDGGITIRSKPGQAVNVDDGSGAVPLATKADLDALRNYIANTMTLPVSGATAGPTPAPPPPAATGTTCLRAK